MMGGPRLANQGPLKFMPGGCWESADVAFASGKRGMGLKEEREREMGMGALTNCRLLRLERKQTRRCSFGKPLPGSE